MDVPEEGEAAVRSALSLNALNRLSRLRRLTEFNRRIREGYDGPRLAAEGDSWFQYPLLLTDTIDHINDTYPVLCSSAAGDLLSGMLEEREYIDAIKDSGADVLLLSAGGNDVCAGGSLATHLEKFSPGLRAADYLKPSYGVLFSDALGRYERSSPTSIAASRRSRWSVTAMTTPYPIMDAGLESRWRAAGSRTPTSSAR